MVAAFSPVEVDVQRSIRGVSALTELVRFVLGTSPQNETDWLEWKVGVDLESIDGQYVVSKQLLGFANRMPDRARRHCEGCAYLVLGAEPQNLAGQALIDHATLAARLRRYVPDQVAWSPLSVSLNGKDVLVITVEPPRAGDPIHTLQKQYDNTLGGTILVRRPGGTHQASSVEITQLESRLLAGARTPPTLVVRHVGPAMPWLQVTAGDVDAWLNQRGQRLLAPLHRDLAEQARQEAQKRLDRPTAFGIAGGIAGFGRFDALRSVENLNFGMPAGFGPTPENRTPDEYRAEVESYLAACGSALGPEAAARIAGDDRSSLALIVENQSARNVEELEIVLHVEGPVDAFRRPPKRRLPFGPRAWGPKPGPFADMGLALRPAIPVIPPGALRPGPRIENGGSTTVTFPPLHLRPEKQERLDSVHLVVVNPASHQLRATWRATSTSSDGVITGTLEIPLADAPIGLLDLVDPSSTD